MFTHGENNSTHEMQTIWEKAAQHIEIALDQDIRMELRMRTRMITPEPNHSQEILDIHLRKVQLCNTTHASLREARNKVV